MSSPQRGVDISADRFKNITDDAVDQARDLATRTAQQMDAGEYGLDAWTRSMSQFFDIVARGSAAHFQTAIAGPCFNAGPDEIPASEEEVPLTYVRDWTRKISIAKSFKDIGGLEIVIPDYSVVLAPLVVKANAVEFTLKVRLKDAHYLGRDYTARLALTQTTGDPSTQVVDYEDVIVAL
jgi:hypothetical protein